jgi:signal transduction histidine kinase
MSFLIIFFRRNFRLLLAAVILITASYTTNYYLGSNISIKYLRNSIQSFLQDRERDFNHLASDTTQVKRLNAQQYTKSELDGIVEKKYGILIYENRNGKKFLDFWSDQQSILPDSMLLYPDGHYFVHLSNGQFEYIKKTQPAPFNRELIVNALIPIRWQYFISTPSLKPDFIGFPGAENRIRISSKPTNFPVKSIDGQILFYLDRIETYHAAKYSWVLLILAFSGILLLLVLIHNLSRSISEKFGAFAGTIFLVIFLLALRGIIYFFPGILHLRQYELFDPTIYSSSFVLSSLGDLLINTFLFCWIVMFIRQETLDYSFPVSGNKWKRWILTTLILVILVIVSYVFADIIQSLVSDARISFNVTNFFSLNIYSFVGFIVLASLAFSFFFFSQILLRLVQAFIGRNSIVLYIIITFTGLLLLTFVQNKTAVVQLDMVVLVWLLAYVWLMLRNLFSGLNENLNMSEVLFWLFVFSISIATVIIFENHKIELEQRQQFANRLSDQMDPLSERMISMALISFDNDFLYQNFDKFKSPYSNQQFKDRLINSNFPGYNRNFDTKIYTYDSAEKPLFNEFPVSFDTLNTIFKLQGKNTEIPDLKFYERTYDKFSYIYKKAITSPDDRLVGYVFMMADPKNYKGPGLAPELTEQQKEFLPEYLPNYFYAIYRHNELVAHYGFYPFPTILNDWEIPKKEFIQKKNGSYDELWQKIREDRVVVVVKRDNYFIEAITLFAWLFSAFLLLVAMFWLLAILIQTRLHLHQIREYLQLNIRSQIHATIIFVSVFSFIVIGVATIYFFISRYNRNNQDRLSHSVQTMANEVQARIPGLANESNPQSIEKLVTEDDLEKLIRNLSEIHRSEVNLYSLHGDLIVASNPFIYTKGILSNKMHPLAYYWMHLLQSVEYFDNDEQMGSHVSFQSVYCPIRVGNGRACAYLNVPYFSTQTELKEEISKFLLTIINLNVFIFLIAGTIALFLTNRITKSFTLISDKMQRINLGKTNEVIEWNSNDEIGVLVREYNKMVEKLEESAAHLAKSEREFAWREMARQVAHEIKNPLTPMKLSIQYLQKAIANNSVNVKELTANVAKTLVEQIDHLSKIAADFSQFANIGNPKNEVFDLHDMLYSLTSLYETTENLLFKWVPVHQRIMVYADKTQLNRLFTNLLQNALEACVGLEHRVISVSEQLNEESIIIKISDNGEGIPEHMKTKIFMPNFTTKSSGTGLGLAMSKTIIEHARGKIWFDTKVGEGTVFYVELPILRATTIAAAIA